ncbi:MAG TPA: hypothetical protein VF506_15170, partial [Streptosporangiaceae bacterium]
MPNVGEGAGLVVVGVAVGVVGVGVTVGVVMGVGVGVGVAVRDRAGVDVVAGGDWTGRTKLGPLMWRPVSIRTIAAPATKQTTIAPASETP